GPPPRVTFGGLEEGGRLTGPTLLTGSVSSSSNTLASWTLGYRRTSDAGSPFTAFASGSTAVTNATLGTFDPTMLLNGMYAVRLQATDSSGQESEQTVNVVVDGQMKIGQFTLGFTDVDIPVAGIPLQVTRTYDSRDKGLHDFGVGWTLGISD